MNKIDSAIFTDRGSYSQNEDSADRLESGMKYVYVLGDGLGGHGKGDLASQTAVRAAVYFLQRGSDIPDAFLYAQQTVLEEKERLDAGGSMLTTLSILKIEHGTARWGHVGDSRIYYFKNEKVAARTKDHSVPQMLVDAGNLKESEIRFHEDRNKLLRCIGVPWKKPMYEMEKNIDLTSCHKTWFHSGRQAFLLCSDGFWELIDEKEMERTLKMSKTADEWISAMAFLVKQAGTGKTMDNYTAIGVIL